MDKKQSKGKVIGLVAVGVTLGGIGLAFGLSKKAEAANPPPEPSLGMANIYGIVLDRTTGKAIPGAMLSIGGHQVLTDSSGNYVLEELALGAYTVSFSKDGYETLTDTVTLAEGNNEVNAQLDPISTIPLIFSYGECTGGGYVNPNATGWWYPDLTFTIKNLNSVSVTHTMQLWSRSESLGSGSPEAPHAITWVPSVDVTVAPGGSYVYHRANYEVMLSRPRRYFFWLQDELGNKSPEVTITRP